jgi:hypothetical protein
MQLPVFWASIPTQSSAEIMSHVSQGKEYRHIVEINLVITEITVSAILLVDDPDPDNCPTASSCWAAVTQN